MAGKRRAKSEGSGVIAGVLAAGIAFFLWARFLSTSHTISFDPLNGVVGSDPVGTSDPFLGYEI